MKDDWLRVLVAHALDVGVTHFGGEGPDVPPMEMCVGHSFAKVGSLWAEQFEDDRNRDRWTVLMDDDGRVTLCWDPTGPGFTQARIYEHCREDDSWAMTLVPHARSDTLALRRLLSGELGGMLAST